MNITILSGGSGNDSLIKGLNTLYPSANIKVIVNAYDNGKSTGICRKVTNTLGVSDIRKNHSRMYKAIYGDRADKRLLEFYNNRYDFTKGNEVNEINDLIDKWQLDTFTWRNIYIPQLNFKNIVKNFFKNPTSNDFEYKDFAVSNIVYSQLYKEYGYELTNKFFCSMLGLDDFVVLNSFDNVYIKAQTELDHIIEDEGETVFWNNPNDKIVKTIYQVESHFGLNPKAIELVDQADLLVISTGTFWSSIQPTIEYLDFYKYVNESKAKKVWVMNNEEDGDSWGVNNLQFIKFMEESGLDLSDFKILVNSDANENLRLKDTDHNFVEKSMGNINGKHDSIKYAKALLSIYYDIDKASKYDKILFDFDDTIWVRNANYINGNTIDNSIYNIKTINDKLNNAVIISGNTYDSIRLKLYQVFGSDLSEFNVDIWADANSTLYRHDKVVDCIESLKIGTNDIKDLISELAFKYDLQVETVGNLSVNYKIKPLSKLERKLLADIINIRFGDSLKAVIAGTTTVDILSKNNNKSVVYNYCGYENLNTLYIGDELDTGNDSSIAKLCTKAIQVNSIEETKVLINLLMED